MSRFTVEFGPVATAKLDELATQARFSKLQVVRRTLDVYTEVVAFTREGKRLLLEDADTGECENLVL